MNRNVTIPSTTLAAIDKAISDDQGNKYRYWLQQVLPHIADAYRQDEEENFRSHLGASILGNDCARAIYYSFRWFTNKKFEGRIIRLFNRGHMEEARMIAALLTIGIEVYQQDASGKQMRIVHAGGHMGGACDGVAIKVPELGDTPALVEFKTHGEKSFLSLKNDGVRQSKFEHYIQMQTYMSKMGLAVGLYLAVNKNTDELYGELISLNSEIADAYLDRGMQIVFASEPPKKLNESSGYYKCRMCDHRPVCHLNATPEFNCRTCISSEPLSSGEWQCTLANRLLSKEDQLKGCSSYKSI